MCGAAMNASKVEEDESNGFMAVSGEFINVTKQKAATTKIKLRRR